MGFVEDESRRVRSRGSSRNGEDKTQMEVFGFKPGSGFGLKPGKQQHQATRFSLE